MKAFRVITVFLLAMAVVVSGGAVTMACLENWICLCSRL